MFLFDYLKNEIETDIYISKNKKSWELKGVNDEINDLQIEIKKLISSTKSGYTKAFNKLIDQRKMVANSTLKQFSECFSKLKDVDFEDIIIEEKTGCDYSFPDFKTETVEHEKGLLELIDDMKAEAHLGESLLVGLIRDWKFSEEIEEAENNLADLKVVASKIRRKCTIIKSTTRYMQSTYKTIKTLQVFTDKFNELLQMIINRSGVEYTKYDKNTKQQIRTIYNMNMALNYFVTNSVLTKKGGIKKEYSDFLSGIDSKQEETIKYIDGQNFYLKKAGETIERKTE